MRLIPNVLLQANRRKCLIVDFPTCERIYFEESFENEFLAEWVQFCLRAVLEVNSQLKLVFNINNIDC